MCSCSRIMCGTKFIRSDTGPEDGMATKLSVAAFPPYPLSHPAGCAPSLSPLCRMPSARLTLPDCASSAAHAW